jgi:type IV pilus assembly protein PilY1
LGTPEENGNNTYMVYFGTGKFFDLADKTVPANYNQTFYGILDNGDAVVTASGGETHGTLVQQSITGTQTVGSSVYRLTTDYDCSGDGWFINLPDRGERVTANPLLRGDRVIFPTLVLLDNVNNANDCSPVSDVTGWLMELSALCGKPVDEAVWDVDGADGINANDFVTETEATDENGEPITVRQYGSGIQSTVGIPTAPAVMTRTATEERKYITGSSGAIDSFTESRSGGGNTANAGRQSWRQIR